jgi:hypothetical protein
LNEVQREAGFLTRFRRCGFLFRLRSLGGFLFSLGDGASVTGFFFLTSGFYPAWFLGLT